MAQQFRVHTVLLDNKALFPVLTYRGSKLPVTPAPRSSNTPCRASGFTSTHPPTDTQTNVLK